MSAPDSDKPLWYSIPALSDKPLASKDVAALASLFEQRGWTVFQNLLFNKGSDALATLRRLNGQLRADGSVIGPEVSGHANGQLDIIEFCLNLEDSLLDEQEKGFEPTQSIIEPESRGRTYWKQLLKLVFGAK